MMCLAEGAGGALLAPEQPWAPAAADLRAGGARGARAAAARGRGARRGGGGPL